MLVAAPPGPAFPYTKSPKGNQLCLLHRCLPSLSSSPPAILGLPTKIFTMSWAQSPNSTRNNLGHSFLKEPDKRGKWVNLLKNSKCLTRSLKSSSSKSQESDRCPWVEFPAPRRLPGWVPSDAVPTLLFGVPNCVLSCDLSQRGNTFPFVLPHIIPASLAANFRLSRQAF